MDHVRRHIEQGLPLVPLFNIDVIEASAKRGAARLRAGRRVYTAEVRIAGKPPGG